MGLYDTVETNTHSIQVKCFGKALAVYQTGDKVVLWEIATFDQYDEYWDQLEKQENSPEGMYNVLNDGFRSNKTNYQIALNDGTYITVRNNFIAAIRDRRQEDLPTVDTFGHEQTRESTLGYVTVKDQQ